MRSHLTNRENHYGGILYMSVRGWYDSEVGDIMARKLLLIGKRLVQNAVRKQRRACVLCGNEMTQQSSVRNKIRVCSVCAADNEAVHGGRVNLIKCETCGTVTGRRNLVMRNRILVCQKCI
jgi:hypothetical protein